MSAFDFQRGDQVRFSVRSDTGFASGEGMVTYVYAARNIEIQVSTARDGSDSILDLYLDTDDDVIVEKVVPTFSTFRVGDVVRQVDDHPRAPLTGNGDLFVLGRDGFVPLFGPTLGRLLPYQGSGYFTFEEFTTEHFERVELP